jgi:hypothetical protein
LAAGEFVDESTKSGDGLVNFGWYAAGPEPGQVATRLFEEAREIGESLRKADPAEFCDLDSEVELMVVNVLAEPLKTRHHYRHLPAAPGFRNRCRATMADQHVHCVQQATELIDTEGGRPCADRRNRGRTRLHEEAGDLLGMLREPVVDPTDEAAKRVMIRTDYDGDLGCVTGLPHG